MEDIIAEEGTRARPEALNTVSMLKVASSYIGNLLFLNQIFFRILIVFYF